MGANILIAAVTRYSGAIKYTYGYGAGHAGVGTQVDCSGLVYNALKDAGYVVPSSGTSFNTKTLFNGTTVTPYAQNNFTAISQADAVAKNGNLQIGDLLLFKSNNTGTQHIGIFYGYDQSGNPMFYGSQGTTGPAVATANGRFWGNAISGEVIVGALRANSSAYNSANDTTLSVMQNTGIAAPIIPSSPAPMVSDPGMHYVEIQNPTKAGRLYDNGVFYIKDKQTGTEFWSVPTASGGIADTTKFANGQVTNVQYSRDPNTGTMLLDTTPSNVQQYLQQQTLSLPTSGVSVLDQQAWQSGYQTLNTAIINDPAALVNVDVNGAISVNAGGGVYSLAGGTLIRYTSSANGQLGGLSILAGPGAGQTFSYTLDGGVVLTNAQTVEIGKKMVNNLVSTGLAVDLSGGVSLNNYNGVINATLTDTGTGNVLENFTLQSVWNGNTRVGSITTRYNVGTGITTQTVDTTLSGNAVNVTYTYDTVTGQAIPHVNSINGQPPTDQAGADAALLKSGALPGQLMYGDLGVAGTNAGGVVATFDATHPSGMQTLANTLVDVGNAVISYAPPLIDAMSFLKAIQTGQPLPVVASGLRIANDLTSMRVPVDPNNPNGATYLKPTSAAINGAASADGALIIHYLGNEFRSVVTQESHPEMYKDARKYVVQELDKYRQVEDPKLAFRYAHLLSYFDKYQPNPSGN